MALLTKAAQRAARWGLSSAGRALHWQCRGQGFDSPRLHHFSFAQFGLSNNHPKLVSPSVTAFRGQN